MTEKLFETAARLKLRFPSCRGDLMVEQLFDLPLVGKASGFDLNTIAIEVNEGLKSATTESFVEVTPNPRAFELGVKLDILKHVIAFKQAEAATARKAVERQIERKKILDAINAKREEKLSQASEDELLARLAALDA